MENPSVSDRPRSQTHIQSARRGGPVLPVGLRPPSTTGPPRRLTQIDAESHPDCRAAVHAAQAGDHPYPDAEKRQYDARLNEAEAAVAKLAQQLQAVQQGAARGQGPATPHDPKPVLRAPARRGTLALAPEPISLDLCALGQTEESRLAVQKAVVTTAEIIAGHGGLGATD